VIFTKVIQVIVKQQKHSIFSQFKKKKKKHNICWEKKPFFLSMDFILFYFYDEE
jgi:hypothetical protein